MSIGSGIRTNFIQSILFVAVIIAGLLSVLATGPATDSTLTISCAGAHQYVRTGSLVKLDARCSDFTEVADADAYLHYFWTLVSKPEGSNASITEEGRYSLLQEFVVDVDGNYEIGLATDAHTTYGDTGANVTILVTASTGNARPTVEAGAYQEVAIGAMVQLQAIGNDADDNTLSYSWSFQPTSLSASLTNALTAMPSFVASQSGDYTLDLVVNDGAVDSLTDAVLIRSRDINLTLPVAVAGADQFVTPGSQVNLNAGNSYNAFGSPLSYSWRMMSRPQGSFATLSSTSTEQPSFIADVAGPYLVRLAVNDGINDSSRVLDNVSEDRLVVVAGNNQRPIADGGADHSVNTGSVAIMDGGASSDPESVTLTYAWTLIKQPSGSTATLSSLDTQSTQLTPDRDGDYLAQLVVNDGADNSAPDIVRVSASSLSGGNSVTVLTSLPYAPAAAEVPTWIQIDTDATDNLRVVSPLDVTAGNFSTALGLTTSSASEADFNNQTGWTIISPATTTINEATTPTFILQRIADSMYYKIVLDFTMLSGNLTVQIDALQAWRCGTNPADCP